MQNPRHNNNHHNIDDLFEKHFKNTTANVEQADVLWDAIKNRRKRPKRFIFLWWIVGCLLLGGSSIYFIKSTQNKTIQSTSKITVKPQEDIAKVIPLEEKLKVPTPSSKNHTLPPSNKEKQTGNTPEESLPKTTPLTKRINTQNISTRTDDLAIVESSTPIQAIPKMHLIDDHPTINTSINTTVKALPSIPHLLLPIDFATLELPKHSIASMEEEDATWDKCWIRQPGTFFVKAYGQASLPLESITANNSNGENNDEYQSLWEERFSPLLSYDAGLQVGYQFPWNGYVSTGVQYQNIQTKYESKQRITQQITVFDEMAYFYINDMGERVWVADSVTTTNVIDRSILKGNTHQLWHIPLQVGYLQKKPEIGFRFGINAEALLNLSKSYKGIFYTETGEALEVDSSQDEQYMSTDIGVSFSAGVHVGYSLNEHWELYTSPRFRFNNNSFLNGDQALNLKYNFVGIRIGLQYHF